MTNAKLVTLKTPGGDRAADRPGDGPRDAADRGADGPRPLGGRVYIETYGCQMNINDTELMEGLLVDEGFVSVDAPERADVILVNTLRDSRTRGTARSRSDR